jgi:hypothetical protein
MKKQLPIISLLVCIISCAQETSLDETIFIPDPSNNRLPAYTERGYNSFGAIYERAYFLATRTAVPCKITCKDGQMHFVLIGYVTDGHSTTLTFSFPAQPVSDYTGLLSLHQKSFDLKDASCKVVLEQEGLKTDLSTILSGNLNFKRAQLLRVDGKDDRVILSGTFEIRFLRNDQVENISDGRFDLGIHRDFYSFE